MSDTGAGGLTGYASIKGNVDNYGDVILDGAYKNLDLLKNQGWSGFNHGGKPVGYITSVEEDSKGLLVSIEFHSTQEAQDVRQIAKERLAAGKGVGMSVMFRTLDWRMGQRDGKKVRELKAIEIVEAGFVMLPVNAAATVMSVKGGSGTTLDEEVNAALELVSDLVQRMGDLHQLRDKGLSEARRDQLSQVHKSIGDLVELVGGKANDEPETASDEQVSELLSKLAVHGI